MSPRTGTCAWCEYHRTGISRPYRGCCGRRRRLRSRSYDLPSFEPMCLWWLNHRRIGFHHQPKLLTATRIKGSRNTITCKFFLRHDKPFGSDIASGRSFYGFRRRPCALQRRGREWRPAADQVGRLFGDHHHGRINVPGHQVGHDGGVDHAQALAPAHFQVRSTTAAASCSAPILQVPSG